MSRNRYNYHDFLAFIGVGGAHPGGLALTKSILEYAQLDHNSSVLDAGCGTGQTAAYIAQTYGCHVTAIDQHPIMLQKAKQRFESENIKVNLVQGDIEHMPFTEASFDVILAESVTVFTNIRQTISEYERFLRQDGVLLDLEMTAIPPLPQEMSQAFDLLYGIEHIPSETEWSDKYEQAGLHNVEVVHNDRVTQALCEYNLPDEDATEFLFSDYIDPSIYHIWDEHQLLTEKFADKLNHTAFRARKPARPC